MWEKLASIAAFFGIGPRASVSELVAVGTVEIARLPPYENAEVNFNQSHNLSGIFCPGPDWCVVVSDELKGFHRLSVNRHGELPAVSHDAALSLVLPPSDFLDARGIAADPKELDLEAIANTNDKVIFVGSHANKRKSGKPNPASHLVAVVDTQSLQGDAPVAAQWASLDKLFRRPDMFPDALYAQLQCGGINVEGATVFGDELLIGLRSPTQGTDGTNPAAYVISTPFEGLLREDFSGAKRHVLPTESPFIGIRSMETVGDTVLIVTGDAGVNDLKGETPTCGANLNKEDPARPFQLRAWKPRDGDFLHPEVLAVFPERQESEFDPAKMSRAKVEGVCLASDSGATVSLFVVYDGSAQVFYLPDIALPQ